MPVAHGRRIERQLVRRRDTRSDVFGGLGCQCLGFCRYRCHRIHIAALDWQASISLVRTFATTATAAAATAPPALVGLG